jgi:hypothetical protein
MMKTLADQMTYESYSKQHYANLAQTCADERSLHRPSKKSYSSERKAGPMPVMRARLAYVIALAVLGALSLFRVVEAIANAAGGGGGHYLVK